MFDLDNWQEIWSTITRNKLRSVLTGFGVFWGIFMLVILLGVGNGFKGGIEQTLQAVAVNSCFFGSDRTSEPYKGHRKGRRWEMDSRDIELIARKARSVDQIAPALYGAYSDKNTVRGMKSGTYDAMGVLPAQFIVQPQIVLYGRIINEVDVQQRRKVCVIGKEVYETLFNVGENPLGQYIRLKGIYFQVIGVVTPVSKNIAVGSIPDQTVFIPFTTMRYTFSRGDKVHFLVCTTKPGYDAVQLEEEVKAILREAHDIAPGDEKAVRSFNIEKEFRMFQNLTLGVNALVWIVGLGALFSGIIGISNIMLVTVRERMREIGVRRALGARPLTILGQIMSESVVLTTVAGLGGFLLGVFALQMAAQAMSGAEESGLFIAPFISFNVGLLSILILIVSGLLAGIMPTLKALQIKAIDAIRDE